MTARTTGRGCGDGGAVIVEAALVMPILLAFMFGLIEYSTTEFQQSQASSAARDGARAGIVLDYSTADQSGSATNDAIQAAARARLGNQQNVTVQVWCVLADGTTTVACNSSQLRPTEGFLRVRVSWPYRSVTGTKLLVPSTISGTSQMSLVGATVTVNTTTTSSTSTTSTTSTPSTSTTTPTSSSTTPTTQPTTTTTIPGCVVSNLAAQNPLPTVKNNGNLSDDLDVTFTTNSSVQCPPIAAVVYPSGGGAASGTPSPGSITGGPANYSVSFSKNQINWQTGLVLIRVTWGASGSQDLVIRLS